MIACLIMFCGCSPFEEVSDAVGGGLLISGTVISDASGKPVKHARVTFHYTNLNIMWNETESEYKESKTDGNGRFCIKYREIPDNLSSGIGFYEVRAKGFRYFYTQSKCTNLTIRLVPE
ncbi:MAG: carboxypeptidase-like regulatory domain-containing protein [Bacteroidia bacterium]|nr:carboxypeptidase-like regulatory domain-containing protein [Bacteroidia bacterium]